MVTLNWRIDGQFAMKCLAATFERKKRTLTLLFLEKPGWSTGIFFLLGLALHWYLNTAWEFNFQLIIISMHQQTLMNKNLSPKTIVSMKRKKKKIYVTKFLLPFFERRQDVKHVFILFCLINRTMSWQYSAIAIPVMI